MAFEIIYSAGGIIDKVKEFPYPQFPHKVIPYVKGFNLNVPATQGVYNYNYTLLEDMELVSIAIACSTYDVSDYWEVVVGDEKICETIYTKELPESVGMGNYLSVVYPVIQNTVITMYYYNNSGNAKQVWFNFKFLRDKV
jgi:hypothetical protein